MLCFGWPRVPVSARTPLLGLPRPVAPVKPHDRPPRARCRFVPRTRFGRRRSGGRLATRRRRAGASGPRCRAWRPHRALPPERRRPGGVVPAPARHRGRGADATGLQGSRRAPPPADAPRRGSARQRSEPAGAPARPRRRAAGCLFRRPHAPRRAPHAFAVPPTPARGGGQHRDAGAHRPRRRQRPKGRARVAPAPRAAGAPLPDAGEQRG